MYLHASAESITRATPPIAAPAMTPIEMPAGLVELLDGVEGSKGGDGSVALGTTDARVPVADC